MSQFKVIEVIDGDTFEVSPGWSWNRSEGYRVRPTGYDAPELGSLAGAEAKDKLIKLILDKNIDLGTAYKIDRGRIVCDVFFNGRKLAAYFPEYQ